MIKIIITTLLMLLGFQNKNTPKHSLHRQTNIYENKKIQITPTLLIIITIILGVIFVTTILLLGIGTESGVYYNSDLINH